MDINKELIDRKILLIPTMKAGNSDIDKFIEYLDKSQSSLRVKGNWDNRMKKYCEAKDENTCEKDQNGNYLYKGCKYDGVKKKCIPTYPTTELISAFPNGKKYNLEPPFIEDTEENLSKLDEQRLAEMKKSYDSGTWLMCYEKKNKDSCSKPELVLDNKPVTNVCNWKQGEVKRTDKMKDKEYEEKLNTTGECKSDGDFTFDKFLMVQEQLNSEKVIENYFKKIKNIITKSDNTEESKNKIKRANEIIKEYCNKKDSTQCADNADITNRGCIYNTREKKCEENKLFWDNPENFKLRGNLKKIMEAIQAESETKDNK